jgi:alanine racemase
MSDSIAQRPTFAEINLDNLASNFHASKQFIGGNLKYMAVVKADAYGHGAIECAKRLEKEGVDWFGVAIPEEGVELRKAGIKSPILCLGSFWPGQESMILDNDLTPVIYDLVTAASLSRAADDKNIDIHIKIDTGMGRVGIRYDEAASFAKSLKDFSNLRVTGLMTHFAVAEDLKQTEFTRLQIERFNNVREEFKNAGHQPHIFDLANSPGAISHPDSRGNMVRLGGTLYGLLDDILPDATERPNLKPVLSLRSRIADVKKIPKGESLGYGRTFTTERDSLIALVPIGYADGYPRGLSNKGKAIVNGSVVPVVGRVSMDWTLLDVTDEVNTKVNDEVIFIGCDGANEITAADLAREMDTIGYEITCGITARVPRIFKG